MVSIPRLVNSLTFFFITQCLAFPLAEPDDVSGLHVRRASIISGHVSSAASLAASSKSTAATITTAKSVNASAIAGDVVLAALLAASSKSAAATANATATAASGEAAITVKIVQPSLCKASDLQYSTTTAIPTGQVQIFPDQNAGWGTTGSIWNFTLDDGVGFSQLTASCQGSSCTGSTGESAEQSGSVVKNPDGVWTLNVTANMDPAVTVIGITSGGNSVSGNFKFGITSTPPCALPVAESCTSSSFNPSSDQWSAYSTDAWLAVYLSTYNLQTFGELYDKISKDVLVPTQVADLACEPGTIGGYACELPAAPALALDCNSTQGVLVLDGLIRISNLLNLLWNVFENVQVAVSDWIDELITEFIVPKVKQKWTAIVNIAQSMTGILIFLFILWDVIAPEAALAEVPAEVAVEGAAEGATAGGAASGGAASGEAASGGAASGGAAAGGRTSGYGVAGIVGVTNALGAVSNFANGFLTTPADDTYLKYTGEYSEGVSTYASYMQSSISQLWRPSNASGFNISGVENALKGGAWTDISNPLAVPNLGNMTESFFETLLITSLINMIWKNNDFYVVFVPYGPVTKFQTGYVTSTATETFSEENCTNHWVNDPNRPNYISCSLNYDGKPGMTFLTQPSSADGGTLPLSEAQFAESPIGFTFVNDDALQSSLTANALHGFNYNYSTSDLADTVLAGASKLATDFVSVPLDTPGLYNLDVCVVTELSFVPGAREYLRAGNGDRHDLIYLDPCTCANFTSNGDKFVDFATENVLDAVTIQVKGHRNQTCLSRGLTAAA